MERYGQLWKAECSDGTLFIITVSCFSDLECRLSFSKTGKDISKRGLKIKLTHVSTNARLGVRVEVSTALKLSDRVEDRQRP